MFKVNNKNTRTGCLFIANFEKIKKPLSFSIKIGFI